MIPDGVLLKSFLLLRPHFLGGVLLVLLSFSLLPAFSAAMDTRLIVRGDDFGMTQGSLPAFESAFREGILTCGSLLVQPPWFEAAAELARKNPGWCIGVHLSLIGEWRGYNWRPVLPRDRVSSLADEDGFLFKSPKELFTRSPRIEEIDAELRAQVNLAKKRGVNPRYIDTHYMGMDDYPGLAEVIQRIGRDYDLPLSGRMGEKYIGGIYRVPIGQKHAEAVRILENLKPGLWLWVAHIGIDSPEQEVLIHSAVEDRFAYPGVGRHRAAELAVLTSTEIKSLVLRKGIVLTRYGEIGRSGK